MNIGIDIDGVINDLESYHLDYGSKFCYENQLECSLKIKEYKIKNIFSWSDNTYQAFMHEYYYCFLLTSEYLRTHVAEVINNLSRKHRIFILTGRVDRDIPNSNNQSIYTVSKQWLDSNEIYYDQLLITNWDKREAIKNYNIQIMIEDNPQFFKLVSNDPDTLFLCYDAPYNKNISFKNLYRVYSWYGILNVINNLEVDYE